MKLGDIFATAGHNLGRNKMRTSLTILAIFIGTLTLTITNGIGAGINQYIDDQVGNLGAQNVLVIQPTSDSGSFGSSSGPKLYNPDKKSSTTGSFSVPVLSDVDLANIAAVSGITSINPFTSPVPDYVMGPNGTKYQLAVSEFIDGTNLDLVAGSSPANNTSNYQIVLPVDYPVSLGFANANGSVNQTVKIDITNAEGKQEELTVTVVGVQQKSLLAISGANINHSLIAALYDWQSQGLPTAIKQQYQAAIARFDTNLSADDVIALKAKLKDLGYLAQTADDRIGIVHQVIGGITVVFNIFGIIALVAAAFGIIKTLLMAVAERTKEIGLMKSMGMSGSQIFTLFSIEAALLGFWGSILGVLSAIGIGEIVNHVASNSFLKDFPGLNLLTFPILTVGGIVLLIILIAFLAGVLPAMRAAQKNPIEALRYE